AESPCTGEQAVCEVMLRATGNEGLSAATQVVVTITLLVLLALVARWFLHRAVDRIVRSAETPMVPTRLIRNGVLGRSAEQSPTDLAATTRRVQRAKTIGSLLKSMITGVLLAVGITMALSELGLNIAPVLA